MVDSIKTFERLDVWQKALDLSVNIYKISAGFPSSEKFGIINQIRRAVSSVPANIAEGFGRQSQKEKLQFYSIAYGSLLEVKSFLYLCERLGYINADDINKFCDEITILQKQLNALSSAVKKNV